MVGFGILVVGPAQGAVNLGTAEALAVLANTTITNTGSTTISGDVGLYPGTSVTGFTSVTLNGTLHVTDGVAQQALIDAATAYGVLQGRTPCTDLTGQVLGMTVGTAATPLLPGVYCFSSSAQLTGDLYLSGGGEYVFQIGSTLITASGSRVILLNGAEACNIFWAVGSSATLGTSSLIVGTILANVSISADTGAVIVGRLFALTGAVTLQGNTITRPTCAISPTTSSTSTTAPTTTTSSTSTTAPTTTTTSSTSTTAPTTTTTSTSTTAPTTTTSTTPAATTTTTLAPGATTTTLVPGATTTTTTLAAGTTTTSTTTSIPPGATTTTTIAAGAAATTTTTSAGAAATTTTTTAGAGGSTTTSSTATLRAGVGATSTTTTTLRATSGTSSTTTARSSTATTARGGGGDTAGGAGNAKLARTGSSVWSWQVWGWMAIALGGAMVWLAGRDVPFRRRRNPDGT